jgi:peptidylprolyl isomerase
MGFPAARDPKSGRTWLTYCYGALGTARGNEPDSGGGTQLFVIIGHSPRHLDRNYTAFGRVVKGIELLSTLPRGTGGLGFYEKPEQRVAIRSMRVAADVPAAERTALQVLRTDTPTFKALVSARRTRSEASFVYKASRIEVCNVPIPTK